MKKSIYLLLLMLALAGLIVAASILYDNYKGKVERDPLAVEPTTEQPQNEEQEKPNSRPAASFTVYDEKGNVVRLSDFFGKPIVLNFWASWCGPCQSEMPDFQDKYLELGDEIHFLMVNMTTGRETKETATSFLEKTNYTFPVYFDTDVDAAMTYNVYSLPTTYFIDAEGDIIVYAAGAIDAETLQRGIDMIR